MTKKVIVGIQQLFLQVMQQGSYAWRKELNAVSIATKGVVH
jgi:hypothetical protein